MDDSMKALTFQRVLARLAAAGQNFAVARAYGRLVRVWKVHVNYTFACTDEEKGTLLFIPVRDLEIIFVDAGQKELLASERAEIRRGVEDFVGTLWEGANGN